LSLRSVIAPYATLFRSNADELQWPSFGQAVLHEFAFAWISVPARRRRWSRWPACLNGCSILVINNSGEQRFVRIDCRDGRAGGRDRKGTRLNFSHQWIS